MLRALRLAPFALRFPPCALLPFDSLSTGIIQDSIFCGSIFKN